MTHNEIYELFWNKFNSCYKVKLGYQTNTIYYFYDESYARRKKLCNINNELTTPPNKVVGVCLFEQNIYTNTLHIDLQRTKICDDSKKYANDFDNIDNIINNILKCSNEFHNYTRYYNISSNYFFEKHYNELIIL